jgi:carboxyl-terminal processing protease
VKIDGNDIGGDLAGAIARMRGASGSLVKLTIRRDGRPALIDYALRRAQVEVHSVVQQSLEPGYGYLRITSFSETTPVDVSRAITHLKRDNPGGLKGLVLDLRNNPGGVLEAGVAVADDFLDSGVIVTADGRTPEARFRMDATPGDLIDGAPLVVLVNGGSASASEIVAGALKDHGRALLVGRRTYGKGSVQTVMPLTHGGAVKLTTSRYFTPSGTSIHGKGIVPDIVEDGPGAPPAELLTARGSPPLTDRDTDVRVALDTLKTRAAVAQNSARPVAVRALVP